MKYAKSFKIGIVGMAIVLSFCLVGCGGNSEKLEWPESGIVSMLPVPNSTAGTIDYFYEDSFYATLVNSSEQEYQDYLSACQGNGFTVDKEETSANYTAFNSDGYKLDLSFKSDKKISIHLEGPKVKGALAWPSIGLATLLPTPQTKEGTVTVDSSSQFVVCIGNTTIDDFNAYVNECTEKGFNVDYDKGDKYYRAHNENGDSLHLQYEGFDTVIVSVYASKETSGESADSDAGNPTQETAPTDPAPEASTPEESSDFRAMMDSYEAFFDEYVEVVKKYKENPASVFDEYNECMAQYADMMSKLNSVDQSELSQEDIAYYLETQGRIMKKLVEVA